MKAMLQRKSTREVVSFICLLVLTAVLISACSAIVRANSGDEAMPAASNGSLQLSLDTFATGLNEPVGIANAGDDRLFIIERAGVVKVIQSDGTVLPTPFLDITDRVDPIQSEEGL
ncbi:MAG: hypothetical protein GWN55_16575, partial [Phycisphaerae bacterium]|nr:PQQ-dependent sugar dehydrogenase [Phycisphaerae bacterium]NIR63120.1 PQQ-dependent sugar dehydrogenase [candidate division Zixibacteria bacterium]NIW44058.1 hypothetical protein [Gammaproteobacteria bacterium]NIP54374.1 PQQ-dependent sugar dehydrogenase [Phycisphaerae bacterium]NIU13250.1 PQQ-dependent sugar dehydrogenase [candidate division Zixibacteria bacterium]